MTNFLTRDNILKILIILVIITLPIVLAIIFGKLKIDLPFFRQTPDQITPTNQEKITKVFLYCPSIADFCTNGAQITNNGAILGFGANLPANTPVLAAFNGQISISQTTLNSGSNSQTLQTILLTEPDTNTNAIYYFVGDVEPAFAQSLNTPVKVGTKLGTITQNISAYNTSLLFQMFLGDPTKVQQQTLQPNSFIIPGK